MKEMFGRFPGSSKSTVGSNAMIDGWNMMGLSSKVSKTLQQCKNVWMCKLCSTYPSVLFLGERSSWIHQEFCPSTIVSAIFNSY